MASQTRMMCTRVALAATLMIGVPSVSSAQEEGTEFGPQISTAPPTGVVRRRNEGEMSTRPLPERKT